MAFCTKVERFPGGGAASKLLNGTSYSDVIAPWGFLVPLKTGPGPRRTPAIATFIVHEPAGGPLRRTPQAGEAGPSRVSCRLAGSSGTVRQQATARLARCPDGTG